MNNSKAEREEALERAQLPERVTREAPRRPQPAQQDALLYSKYSPPSHRRNANVDERVQGLSVAKFPGVTISTWPSKRILLMVRPADLRREIYRDTSLIRNSAPLGPYSRNMPRDLWWS